MLRGLASCAVVAAVAASLGCGGGPAPIAFENKVFYEYGAGGPIDAAAFEKRYPPLDLAADAPKPEYVGVTILGGGIHISRPKNWVIRAASNAPGQRYIEYVSRNQYIVAIRDRGEYPNELWRDVLARYEDDAKKAGAELIGGPVPVATWNAQGRAYVVRRPVQAAKAPLVNESREYIVRGDRRVVLVQVVHQPDELSNVSDEVLRVLTTMRVE